MALRDRALVVLFLSTILRVSEAFAREVDSVEIGGGRAGSRSGMARWTRPVECCGRPKCACLVGVEATLHTLRHTFATRAVEKGVDKAILQVLLGHSRLETTRRYLRPTAERMREGDVRCLNGWRKEK